MERTEIIDHLAKLRFQLDLLEQLDAKLTTARERVEACKKPDYTKLEDFDASHKPYYVQTKAGDAPIKPSRSMAIALPLYLQRVKEYKHAVEERERALVSAESTYYEEYSGVRAKLSAEAESARDAAVAAAEATAQQLEAELERIAAEVETEDLVPVECCNKRDLDLLSAIFRRGRADTMKEAMNLLEEDNHRRKMEEYQEEQLRLTRLATEAAEAAAESARKAESYTARAEKHAAEAAKQAEEAMNLADEAMNLATEAYDQANKSMSIAKALEK